MALSTSDISDIRAAEKTLAEAFESSERTAWVDFYTDDAIFVGPGVPAIEGRTALLDIAPQISISSMEIVAESTLGTDEFAATLGRESLIAPCDVAAEADDADSDLGCAEGAKTLSHGLAPRARRAVAHRP